MSEISDRTIAESSMSNGGGGGLNKLNKATDDLFECELLARYLALPAEIMVCIAFLFHSGETNPAREKHRVSALHATIRCTVGQKSAVSLEE